MHYTYTFRPPIVVLALVLLTLFSSMQCEKNVAEINKLPAITQTGEGTFGCLVDGVALLPKGSLLSGPKLQCNYSYLSDATHEGYYFLLAASDKNSYSDGIHGIMLRATKVELQTKKYMLDSEQGVEGKLSGVFQIFSEGTINEYSTNQIYTGELTITRFDNADQIVSGTFWFDAINNDGKVVQVREGRFDANFVL
jgi:hypothetical protein